LNVMSYFGDAANLWGPRSSFCKKHLVSEPN
jgi:hypothetical protein